MKLMKILGAAAVAAMALMAFASTASATTLTINGVPQTGSVTITASLKAGTSAVLKNTSGSIANTCKASHVHGETVSPFSAAVIGGPITTLTFSECTEEPVTVDTTGTLSIEWTSGLNGTVRSNGAEVTVPSPFGRLTCKTSNTDIGQLTGVNSGNATMDINAVLNCGILLPSAKWEGTYVVTSPTGLDVTA